MDSSVSGQYCPDIIKASKPTDGLQSDDDTATESACDILPGHKLCGL